jgi:23S rRNA (adenine2030-N6)-methyltransferase
MNYRHAFHAGNFADVVKHAVITRILVHLKEKSTPLRVIDTHAGTGLYDLAGPEASRTQEWRGGIARLLSSTLSAPASALLSPYLDAIAVFNASTELRRYPGSPLLTLHLLRRQDRLLACELEPNAAATLEHHLRADKRVKVIAIDGWTALRAYVPPKERRGLVIIDPPYEDKNEFSRAVDEFQSAHRKWPTGIYVLWYPITTRSDPDALARHLRKSGITKTLRAELLIDSPNESAGLTGTGLIIVNPPWLLHDELKVLLPELSSVLARGGNAGFSIDWLARGK